MELPCCRVETKKLSDFVLLRLFSPALSACHLTSRAYACLRLLTHAYACGVKRQLCAEAKERADTSSSFLDLHAKRKSARK
eukprot:2681417-Pyramimonas_sp.AAC.2